MLPKAAEEVNKNVRKNLFKEAMDKLDDAKNLTDRTLSRLDRGMNMKNKKDIRDLLIKLLQIICVAKNAVRAVVKNDMKEPILIIMDPKDPFPREEITVESGYMMLAVDESFAAVEDAVENLKTQVDIITIKRNNFLRLGKD